MKTSKFAWQVIAVLAILSMALAGCGTPATPAPATSAPAAQEATQAPAATAAPAATSAPAATEAPAATTAPEATQAPAAATGDKNLLGIALPADAAPWSQQVDVGYGEFGPWEHWAEGIYGLGGGSAINYYTQEALVALDPYFKVVPVMADSWESNADTTQWTFHLHPGIQWSDGKPITAQDWVFTFQYQADPANGFDFNWYYDPIKNLDKATKGEVKPTEIGVSAKDDLTLVFDMKAPTPYWPALMASSFALPKQAIDKCGKRVWSVKPECSVASGPYVLTKYVRDQVAVVSLNKNYKGTQKPIVTNYVFKYSPQKTTDTWALYQNDQVTTLDLSAQPANVQEQIKNDPQYKDQLVVTAQMGTQYLTFDTTKPPFNDQKVRMAFALALDRETLCKDVLKGTCRANYSILPIGMPGYQGDKLKEIQAYNPDKAKQLLADAGFPGGKGFPELTYYVRSDSSVAPEAVVAMWQETLGVKLNIESFDRSNFMQKMLAHQFQIYQLAYGMDYPDPANFLTLFLSTANRHEWNNKQYDDIITKSNAESDPAKRADLLYQGEKLLLEDVGVVPINSNMGYSLVKPWFASGGPDAQKKGAPFSGLYSYNLASYQYYKQGTPASWPPIDPNDLK